MPIGLPSLEDFQAQQQARLGLRQAPRPEEDPTLQPQEEQSVLKKLGNMGLTALGFLGQTLDKTFGGRAIRGLLGGKPQELASLIPLSDTLGITDPNNIVYGRELLTNAGLLDKPTPGFDFGDVLGFGADVLLDPASWIHPLSKTLAGREFEKAGAATLPRGLGEQARGTHYLESQLAGLEPVAAGALPATDLVKQGLKVTPRELEQQVLEKTGETLRPRFNRAAGPATPVPIDMPFEPQHLMPMGAGQGTSTFDDALRSMSEGLSPTPGNYFKAAPDASSYQKLVVPHNMMAGGVPEMVQHALSETPTGAATPLRGTLGIGLPFMNPSFVLGTGETGARVLDKIGGLGNWIKSSALSRVARTQLDPKVDELATAAGQDVAATLGRPGRDALTAEIKRDSFKLKVMLEPVYQVADPQEIDRLVLMAAEGVPIPKDLASYKADLAVRRPDVFQRLTTEGKIDALDGHFGTMEKAAEGVRSINQRLLGGDQALGLPQKELVDNDLEYVKRLLTPLPPEGKVVSRIFGRTRQAIQGSNTSQLAREDIYRAFPEGTAQINDMLRQADPAGLPMMVGNERVLKPAQVEQEIRRNLTRTAGDVASGSGSPTHFTDLAQQEIQAKGLFPSPADAEVAIQQMGLDPLGGQANLMRLHGEQGEQLLEAALAKDVAIGKQAQELGEHLRTLPSALGTGQGANFFRENPILSTEIRGLQSAKGQSSAQAFYEGARGMAKPEGEFAAAGQKSVSVPEVLKEANLTGRDADGISIGEKLAAKSLGVSLEDLPRMHIPEEVAHDMTKWMSAWSRPESLTPILDAYDAATNMMKTWLTRPFPAFHVRNMITDLFNNWRDGALSVKSMEDAKNLQMGHSIPALPGMKGTMALDDVLEEASAHGIAFNSGLNRSGDLSRAGGFGIVPGSSPASGLNQTGSVLAESEAQAAKTMAKVPGRQVPTDIGETLGNWGSGFTQDLDLNPLHVAGVTPGPTTNTIIRQADKASNAVEDWTHLAHYIEKRRQGFSPAEATAAVKKYHPDYADLTSFERSFAKRVVPFYTFSARSLPPLLEDLATRPAKLAASIRGATSGSHDEAAFVPPYIAEGTNIPLPGAPEGYARYLASLGLPFEDEFVKSLGSFGAGDLKRGFGNLLSGLNPMLRYPIEEATGVQLHTGRQLTDLRSSWAGDLAGLGDEDRARLMTQILGNTPASRFISTGEQIADPRKDVFTKGLNLLTGARITDVDLAKQQEISARESIKDILKGKAGVGTFEDIYVKPQDVSKLSPDELQMYVLYKALQRKQQAANLAKKKIGLMSP